MFSHIFNVARSLVREHAKKTKRSPKWPGVEQAFLKMHKTCAACGTTTRLQVHHVQPYHLFPELELDPNNLIALCMGPNECHLKIGHGDNFRSFNKNVLQDASNALAHPGSRTTIEASAKQNRQESP